MENNSYILNELKEISTILVKMEKINPYSLPSGYFINLPQAVLSCVKLHDNLSAVSAYKETDVPAGYFDSLADNILKKISASEQETASSELRILSPMLYSIHNENVFNIPRGYFNNVSDSIINKLKPGAKVINFKSTSRAFVKYAVAASFTGLMALGIFKFTANTKSNPLPEYVTAGMKIENVDAELAKISNTDIVNYLKENGTDIKDAVVANSVDANELPTQDDYLLDEKTLDNYLNSININDLKN